MFNLYAREMELSEVHNRVFRKRSLTISEMKYMHESVQSVVEKENRRIAVRAELFALLYICHPEALFKKTKYSRKVKYYMLKMLGLETQNISSFKKDIIFLYFNDKKFRGVVTRTIEVATRAVQKENDM